MKKIFALILVLCLCAGLCACVSMDKFEDNLGSSYKRTTLSDDDLEDYAELLDIDVDDYDVKSAIQATHSKKKTTVVIIECGSQSKAKKLANDAEDIVDYLERAYGSSYSFGIETKGRFVLFGEKTAIDDALGE